MPTHMWDISSTPRLPNTTHCSGSGLSGLAAVLSNTDVKMSIVPLGRSGLASGENWYAICQMCL